ncbi:MAG: hypothetical protein NC548_65790 [Lachnospiraceae bacterium]|nr:hypothetical protein [Lachnospiraceae bacterium]
MQIFARIMAKLCGWRKQPTQSEIKKLYDYYHNEVIDRETISSHFDNKDYINLIHVARYADMGLWTAIQAAFCLGFRAGKGGAV